ncbi:collagen-like protein, partial [Helicobacter baculiformis]
VNLQATRPTQIRAYDTSANSYYNVTGCDYSGDLGKTPKIVQPYTKINTTSSMKDEEVNDLNTSKDSSHDLPEYRVFEIKERVLGKREKTSYSYCDDGYDNWKKSKDYTAYYNGDLRTLARWTTEYKTINTGTTQVYTRPRNDGDDDAQYNTYKFFYVSKAKKELKRTPLSVDINIRNLDDVYRHNVELVMLSNKLNLNAEVLKVINTPEFSSWKQQYYHPGNGNLCLEYSTSGDVWKPSSKARYCTWGETPSSKYSCVHYNDWVIP